MTQTPDESKIFDTIVKGVKVTIGSGKLTWVVTAVGPSTIIVRGKPEGSDTELVRYLYRGDFGMGKVVVVPDGQ